MATIRISDEDYEFLKELQHELNTQTNDGNADPVYWGVMDTREVGVPDGCGDQRIYTGDGGTDTLEGTVAFVAEYLVDDEDMEAWNKVDKTDIDDVVMFCREKLGMPEVRIVDVEKKSEISRQTGAFLTKRACQQYVERYGYNHSNPRTYAMTAYRNFELERLLKILKTMVLTEEKIVNSKKSVDEAMAEVEEKAKAFTDAHKGEDSEKILAEMRGEEPACPCENCEGDGLAGTCASISELGRCPLKYRKEEGLVSENLGSWDKFSNIDDAIDNYCCHDGNIVVFTESLNGEPLDDADDREEVGAAFKAGANWQKQMMMKDAVTAEVRTVEDFMGTTTFRCVCDKYKVGDKAKFIIIKEG